MSWLIVLIYIILIASAHSDPHDDIINFTPAGRSTAEQQAAAAECSKFEDLYGQIDLDLATWAKTGISQADMMRTIKFNTTTSRSKGMALGFEGGKAYVVEKPQHLKFIGHHVQLFHLYMRSMVDLERRFGSAIPDVEFVIHTADRPFDMAADANGSFNPMMRFGKSANHFDILIPHCHFNGKRYDSNLLTKVAQINERYPWHNRTAIAFARYSVYDRHLNPLDTPLRRLGFKNRRICRLGSQSVMACRVRNHFQTWAKRHPDMLDVSSHKHRPMDTWAQFKYLIQLDGQGLSSKMEQLLTMGSVVMREESGYYGYYYSMIKPWVHYIPFWKTLPEEILEVVKWARENDQQAAEIARVGQAFAIKYLTADARACYWLTLLTRYAKLLRYRPGRANRHYDFYMPIEKYLNTVGRAYEEGKKVIFEP